MKPLLLNGALSSVLVFVTACSDPGKNVKHYVLTGKIVEVDKANQAVVVNMEEIKGYMDAMVMPVHVKEVAELSPLSPGDSIRADLVVHDNGSWIQDVRIVAKAR